MSGKPFTINTNLKTTVSPVSGTFIDEYLETKKKGELSGIGNDVISVSQKYCINAAYIVAHAAVESGWGSSRIAKEKNNLFGWSAFDDSPYTSASGFPSRAACIDFVMGRINVLYLTLEGKYYRKTPCLGHRPPNGYGMNVHYATDPNWGHKIAACANALERAYERTVPEAERSVFLADASEASGADVAQFLEKARSASGHQIKYQLGEGGMTPNAILPGNRSRGCDCSGYVCWCIRLGRQTNHVLYTRFNGGWINTDAIVHDANSTTGFFTRLDKPKIGGIIVYPSKRPSIRYGHVGIITGVRNNMVTKVIHCSLGNYRQSGDAIMETNADVFNKPGVIFAWYEGLE